jgi:hypothetical protein
LELAPGYHFHCGTEREQSDKGTTSAVHQSLIIASIYVENLLSNRKAESLKQNDEYRYTAAFLHQAE